MNLVPAVVKGVSGGLTVEMDGGHVMTVPVDTAGVTVGARVDVGIRPEDVEIGTGGPTVSVNVLERLGGVTIPMAPWAMGCGSVRRCREMRRCARGTPVAERRSEGCACVRRGRKGVAADDGSGAGGVT